MKGKIVLIGAGSGRIPSSILDRLSIKDGAVMKLHYERLGRRLRGHWRRGGIAS